MRRRKTILTLMPFAAVAPVLAGPVSQFEFVLSGSGDEIITVGSDSTDFSGWTEFTRQSAPTTAPSGTASGDSFSASWDPNLLAASAEQSTFQIASVDSLIETETVSFEIASIDGFDVFAESADLVFVEPGERVFRPPPPDPPVVPLPGAASLGLLGLLILGSRRRRTRAV